MWVWPARSAILTGIWTLPQAATCALRTARVLVQHCSLDNQPARTCSLGQHHGICHCFAAVKVCPPALKLPCLLLYLLLLLLLPQARGCPLRSVTSVPTPASQSQRLQSCGWTAAAAAAADMAAVYYSGSSNSSSSSTPGRHQGAIAAAAGGAGGGWLRASWQAERRRIEGLELLDELEEWKLLQVCWEGGCRGGEGTRLLVQIAYRGV